ncbi:MAG: PorV/PorQ family protein [Candidatus Electryonea clarkiae]|nr:PorV/PorQ family protein [Candidatus Electryonea clarkiae]MDP8286857.1 PorV/PorQ family protein [Candidatus Electryonea clarkiae]
MKNIRYIVVFVLAAALMIPLIGSAEDFAKVGTVGTQFLKIPIGARGVGMGNAFAALSNDVSAMYWNPAGLTHVEGNAVFFERVNWLADMSYDAVGYARKISPSWGIGVFAASLNSGDVEETTVSQPNGTGEYWSVTDWQMGISAATQLTNKFSIGSNFKYISEDLDGTIAGAWVVDIGTLYDTRWNTVKLSMNIRNFGPEIELDGNYYDYDNGTILNDPTGYLPYHFPMTFKLGMAIEPYTDEMHRLTLVADLEHPNDNIERYNLGGEYGFRELFFLRGGYTIGHDTQGFSAGMGSGWQGFGIDYAISDFGILEMVHRFNVHYNF